jgi:predicted CopG family antitoxin
MPSNLNKIIRISEEVHEALLKLGAKGETFDDIIRRLIKMAEEQKKNE